MHETINSTELTQLKAQVYESQSLVSQRERVKLTQFLVKAMVDHPSPVLTKRMI